MKELLTSSFTRLNQLVRCRKVDNEFPTGWPGPVIEGLQRRWIILAQGLLELIDQRRAVLD